MRKPIIAGNWKLNKTPSETVTLIRQLRPLVEGAFAEVVVCPTAACLFAAKEALSGCAIALGAQNVYFEESGAYTGEIGIGTLLELGVEYVILGHSERRQYFGETDETVNKKVLKCLENGLRPIVCVGEHLQQREHGITDEVVRAQIKLALHGVAAHQMEQVVIAYEPVWAIGTGVTATKQQANDTIRVIRKAVAELYSSECANNVRIQYGGSMNADNVSELMAMSDIDGGLIGGASLNAESFAKIVNY